MAQLMACLDLLMCSPLAFHTSAITTKVWKT